MLPMQPLFTDTDPAFQFDTDPDPVVPKLKSSIVSYGYVTGVGSGVVFSYHLGPYCKEFQEVNVINQSSPR